MKRYLPYIVIVALLVILFSRGKEEVIIIPPKKGEFVQPDPRPIVKIDTIYIEGKPIVKEVPNKVNEKLLEEYQSLRDSVAKIDFVKDKITERTYREQYKDSNLTITVTSEVTGHLKSQKVTYLTNPQEVKIRPNKARISVEMGSFMLIPTEPQSTLSIGLKTTLKMDKKNLDFGYDNRGNVLIGASFKLF